MVESSKILTVSYGTFSCTLEGFEDSFSTMKAIAEYFRDLAAEDRYFGAEPPTPDVEMISKIAEREIARRVEAHSSDEGIHLRAAPQAAVAETAAAETEAVADDAPAMPPAVTPPAAVLEGAAAFFAQSQEDDTAEDADLEEVAADDMPAAPAHPDPTSVAAKLQRIQAVVGQSDALEDADFADDAIEAALPDMSEAEPADAAMDADDRDAPVEEATAEDDIANDVAIDGTEEVVTDTEEDDVAAEADTGEGDTADATGDDTDEQISQVLKNLERAGANVSDDVDIVAASDDTADADTPQDPADDVDVAAVLGTDADADTAEVEEEKPAPAKQGLRARILRVARKSPAPEPEEAPVADIADPAAPAVDLDGADDLTAYANVGPDALSDNDEADLQAELAALSDDDADADASQDSDVAAELEAQIANAASDAQAEPDADEPARAGRASLPDTDDAEMTRIMEQADEELSNPEGSRRRAAIAQLKAAVAATEAARQLGDDTDAAAKTEDAFREDLDQVVRPRRAARTEEAEEPRAERPRPGPLKLVASQRVDAAEAADNGADAPVRPRRVAMDGSEGGTAGSFAEFAADMGATELPDLLEAAAAYTAYIEGESEFSRPQIMRKVQASTQTAFSREDGLRSFGTLLRQGRINKAGNGRFQVSDQTRFKPEQKAG